MCWLQMSDVDSFQLDICDSFQTNMVGYYNVNIDNVGSTARKTSLKMTSWQITITKDAKQTSESTVSCTCSWTKFKFLDAQICDFPWFFSTTHHDAHGSFTKFTDPEVLTEVFRKGRCVSRQKDSNLNGIFVIFRHFYEYEPWGDFKVDTVN